MIPLSIADILGRAPRVTMRGRRIFTHRFRRSQQSGELNHKAKLTDAQAREIRMRYLPYAIGYSRLAQEYGVSMWTIRDIVKGRTR